MIGFGGYLIGWIVYILSVLGALYFSFRLLGRLRSYLIFKMFWSLLAALLLAPWYIEVSADIETAYWAPAVVVGLIQGLLTTPQEALIHLKPIAVLLALFWFAVLTDYFLKRRKRSSAEVTEA